MKTLTCVCIPDNQSSQKIYQISQDISSKCLSRDALQFKPHFTIRGDFKIKDRDIVPLKQDFKLFCQKIKPINLHLVKYGFYPWRIIYLDIKKNKYLRDLHNKSMDLIEKYRTSWIPDQYRNNDNFEGKQKDYTLKYGYHFCYEFFSPHFTVAGNDMTEDSFQVIKKQLQSKMENIHVSINQIAFLDRDNENKPLIVLNLGK